MIKYPSIEQFRHIVRTVQLQHDYQGKDDAGEPIYQHTSPYPILTLNGTVKLHGTNAGIVRYKDGSTKFQSRERELTLEQDNAQFMLTMSCKQLDFLFDGIDFDESIAVYGEWCGQGIQTGVAVSQLPRMFVIFGWKVDGQWKHGILKSDHLQQIYDIREFETYSVDVDFNQPEYAQAKIVELTLAVEAQCPVGKYFGIDGVGEGIVFSTVYNGEVLRFKSKGEKHSASKVKTIAAVNVEELESLNAFVDYAVTELRLKQGLEKLTEMGKPLDRTSTGDFIRWVISDIVKEETDTITQNNFDVGKINPLVSKKAKNWFFEKC
jgi:hypothetical protein